MLWVYIVKTRKKLFITSNMTVSARRVDDDVRKKRVDKVVDLSVGPTRQIRRWQRHSIRRMGVGFKGRQSGMPGRAPGGR